MDEPSVFATAINISDLVIPEGKCFRKCFKRCQCVSYGTSGVTRCNGVTVSAVDTVNNVISIYIA